MPLPAYIEEQALRNMELLNAAPEGYVPGDQETLARMQLTSQLTQPYLQRAAEQELQATREEGELERARAAAAAALERLRAQGTFAGEQLTGRLGAEMEQLRTTSAARDAELRRRLSQADTRGALEREAEERFRSMGYTAEAARLAAANAAELERMRFAAGADLLQSALAGGLRGTTAGSTSGGTMIPLSMAGQVRPQYRNVIFRWQVDPSSGRVTGGTPPPEDYHITLEEILEHNRREQERQQQMGLQQYNELLRALTQQGIGGAPVDQRALARQSYG